MSEIRNFLEEFKQNRDFKSVYPKLEKNIGIVAELLEVMKTDEYPYADHASWIASNFFERYPEQLKPFISEIQSIISTTHNHSIQRNLIRIFIYCREDISENGAFLNVLVDFITDTNSLPALKINSLKVIEKQYLTQYPELVTELKALVDLHSDDQRPYIKSYTAYFYKKYSKQF